MGLLVGFLILPLAVAVPVTSLRQAILRRDLARTDSALELTQRDAAELHALPIYRHFEVPAPILTEASADLALRDVILMELAYIEPGTVDPREVGFKEFREFVGLHELLRRDAADLLAAEPPAAPRVWERVTGRAEFTRLAVRTLVFAHDLRLIRGYWAEMAARARGRLRDGPMLLELEDLALALRHRVNALVAVATARERAGRRSRFMELSMLAQNLNQEQHLRNCQKLMDVYVRRAKRDQLEDFRAQARALDVQERRRSFHVVP